MRETDSHTDRKRQMERAGSEVNRKLSITPKTKISKQDKLEKGRSE